MNSVLIAWESGWLEAKVEAFMWKQLLSAYNFDHLYAAPKKLQGDRAKLNQYDSFESALQNIEGKRVFVCPPGRHEREQDIENYMFPKSACYVFGNAVDNCVRFIKEDDDVVTIRTVCNTDMFAISAAAIILDEHRQQNNLK